MKKAPPNAPGEYMERLPRGSNFKRAKMLWELGLHVAGNPLTPYGGDRDMCITVGNGSGTNFRPALRMATGSPILAYDVTAGNLDMAMINPSGLLTQAYRGVGLFEKPLPLRVIGVYPTWDWFIFVVHPKTGLRSLHDVKEQRYPLHVSVKEDVTHSTRVIIDQVLGFYGFSLADIVSWGGKLNVTGAPADPRRMSLLPDGQLDAIFDEGLAIWFNEALKHGMVPLDIEPEAFAYLKTLGWRQNVVPASAFSNLEKDHACIDYSGWPLYAREDLPEQMAYDVAAAFAARQDEIPWEETGFKGDILQVFEDTYSTPLDVPLHPGAERFYREHRASRKATP
jgi:TRAP-type uncharacterized transport system substrate-binding protein